MDRREMEPEGFGYCNLHETPVDESEYEWKGCWNCPHFSEGDAFDQFSKALRFLVTWRVHTTGM